MKGFFSLFLLLFLFSVTIYLNLFGVRYELRVLDTYLFNERFLNACWVPHLWWPPKAKRHLKTGVIPRQGFSAQVSYTLSKPLELHSSYIKWPMYTFITKKFYCSFTFPKFCAMIILSCTLEEILTLNLKAIHILPRAFSCVFQQMPLTSHSYRGL